MKWWAHLGWQAVVSLLCWHYYTTFGLIAEDFWTIVYFLSLNVAYFYLVVFLLMPSATRVGYTFRSRWWGIPLSILLQVLALLFACLTFTVIMLLVSAAKGTFELDLDFSQPFQLEVDNIREMTFLFLSVSPLSGVAFFFIERKLVRTRSGKRLYAMFLEKKSELVLADNTWLQAQLNPHLLANLMSAIEGSVMTVPREQVAKAANYVGTLMNGYVECIGDRSAISIDEELTQVRLFLRIHVLAMTREGSAKYIKLVVDKVIPQIHILPMMVLVLGENALHHATKLSRRYPAIIRLMRVDGGLEIVAENAFDPKVEPPPSAKRHGVALRNVRKRVLGLHPRATFRQHEGDGIFRISIFIPEK